MEPREDYIQDYQLLRGGEVFFDDSHIVYSYDGFYYNLEYVSSLGKTDLRTKFARKNLGLTNEKIHKC